MHRHGGFIIQRPRDGKFLQKGVMLQHEEHLRRRVETRQDRREK
ncbi:MAG TPA: hypothetical protein VMV49_09380 [Candidatus Deferrimicrobium sp.]|nr:hypothetical protein [Candidatus Deferrimicrobium sp.]